MLAEITWPVHPIIFSVPADIPLVGGFTLRWYALMFIIGFFIGIKIMEWVYRREGLDPERVYYLFLACFIGTLVGARLGHCLFYDPDYYLAHPVEIFKTWKGGLASHGGTIGVILCVWYYAKKDRLPILWLLDRLSIAVAPVAALIRMGNLFNHEIYGHETTLPWATRFVQNVYAWERGAEPIYGAPSHPTQVYEALAYVLTFVVCWYLYRQTEAGKHRGVIFGVFLCGIFGSRFFIEYLKNVQVAFEEGMLLDMGQLLSIPFILLGIWFIWRGCKSPAFSLNSHTNHK